MGDINFTEEELQKIERVCQRLNISIEEFIKTSSLMMSDLILREMDNKCKYIILELSPEEYNKIIEMKRKNRMHRTTDEKFIKKIILKQ